MGDALTHALVDADLWRSGSTIDLESGDGQVRVRVHLPERSQSSRTFDLEVAHRMRSVIARVLLAEGYGFIFTDALWQEKAGRGWSVVGRARRPQSAQPDADA